MGRGGMASDSVIASQKASSYDEIFMQHTSQFADSLKDLKNLREQLYSAAEYFESSYDKDNHKQFVVESSKDYVAKALVNTVDHLGSVANKFNRLLEEKAKEFTATNCQFSCIEKRLSIFQGFISLRGVSQHSLMMEAAGYHKHYNHPETLAFRKSKLYGDCSACPPSEVQQPREGEPDPWDMLYLKAFLGARTMKPPPSPLSRKEQSRMASTEPSPNPLGFSFTKIVPNKEPGKRSISPLRFPIKRSGSFANRSVSPSPSANNPRCPSDTRRAISASRRPAETTNREAEMESFTKRSKHLLKALLNVHRPKKEIVLSR